MLKLIQLILIIILATGLSAQQLLTMSDAISITLENDYNIKVAENAQKQAKNNALVYNNGYLPQVVARSGASYALQNSTTNYYNGSSQEVDGGSNLGYNASLAINYTLFDGMYRSYNFEKSKELFNLSKLQVRQIIENSLLELFTAYYSVANLAETNNNLKKTLEISKTRLIRAKYGAEYGTNTQLDVLNAQVDVNNDSINVLNSTQNLSNAKRNLNVIMGREVTRNFQIDTTIHYEAVFELDTLLTMARTENIRMLKAQKNFELSGYDIKLWKSNWLPTLGISGSYGLSGTSYNEQYQIENQLNNGPRAELNLTWNIFDGGITKTGIQNARIAEENNTVVQEQTQKKVERDVINAYTTYKNSLFVLEADKANVVTTKRNFERSEEQYRLGQLTSVEFRQAQLNMLRAQTAFNQAKYQAKIYEMALFKLTGQLMNIKF